MEQITSDYLKRFLKENKIELTSTHSRLSTPIIRRMCHKMDFGIKFGDIKVCDNLIIDGHHRYVSSLITNFGIARVPCHKTSATQACDWHDVEFDDKDWDTDSRISYLNRQDAAYNGVDIETLKKLTDIQK